MFRAAISGQIDIQQPRSEFGASLVTRAIFSGVGVSYLTFLSNLFCACTISHTTQPNYRTALIRDALNMSKIIARVDSCFKKAVGFLKKYQNMALSNAMKLADFSAQEQACRAKRMCLHRLWKKATNGSKNDDYLTPLPRVVDLSTTEGTESSVTGDSGGVAEVEVVSNLTTVATKIPRIRLAIKAAQVR